jgi:deoxycytidylate deaminase
MSGYHFYAKCPGDSGGAIGAAIVNHDNLVATGVILTCNRAQAFGKEFLLV